MGVEGVTVSKRVADLDQSQSARNVRAWGRARLHRIV